MYRAFRKQLQTTNGGGQNGGNCGQQTVDRWMDLAYLRSRLHSAGFGTLIKELCQARARDANNSDLDTLVGALLLSQDALLHQPQDLPSQLLARIKQSTGEKLASLLEQCRQVDDCFLMPRDREFLVKVGEQLISCPPLGQEHLVALAVMSDGTTVVTCDYTGHVAVTFDISQGTVGGPTMKTVDKRAINVHLCCDDTVIVVACVRSMEAFRLPSAQSLWRTEVPNGHGVCATGPRKSLVVLFDDESVYLYDASTGLRISTISLPDDTEICFSPHALCWPVANERHAVSPCENSDHLVVVDVVEQRIVATRQLCEVDDDEKCYDDTDDDDDDDVDDDDDDDDDDEDESGENARRELSVRGLVLSEDGKHVIYSAITDSALHFLDILTLDTVKIYRGETKYKPTPSDIVQFSRFHITADGRYLYHRSFHGIAITVWDLLTARSTCLRVDTDPTDLFTVDLNQWVTISNSFVCAWDISRPCGKNGMTSVHDVKAGFEDRTIVRIDQGQEVLEREGILDDYNLDDDDDDEDDEGDDEGHEDGEGAQDEDNKDAEGDGDNESDDGEPFYQIPSCVLLENERYLLFALCKDKETYLQVYDIATDTVVRQGHALNNFDEDVDTISLLYVRGSHVVCQINRHMYLLDVDKMTVVLTFEAETHVHSHGVLVDDGNKLLIVSKSGHHLDLYSTQTGKVDKVIEQEGDSPRVLLTPLVNKTTTMAVVQAHRSCALAVFDLARGKHLYTVQNDSLGTIRDYTAAITDDGRFFLNLATVPPATITTTTSKPDAANGSNDNGAGCSGGNGPKQYGLRVAGIVIYDLEKQTVVNTAWDKESANMGIRNNVYSFCLVDNTSVFAAHDNMARVYSIPSGEVLHSEKVPQMEGIFFHQSPDRKVVVTTDERSHNRFTFRLWRSRDCSLIASCHLEVPVATEQFDIQLLGEGGDFALLEKFRAKAPVLFLLHGKNKHRSLGCHTTALDSLPQLYQGQDLDLTIKGFKPKSRPDVESDED